MDRSKLDAELDAEWDEIIQASIGKTFTEICTQIQVAHALMSPNEVVGGLGYMLSRACKDAIRIKELETEIGRMEAAR